MTIADSGDWIVRNLITSDDIGHRDGIADCEPVSSKQRSAEPHVFLLQTATAPTGLSPLGSLTAG